MREQTAANTATILVIGGGQSVLCAGHKVGLMRKHHALAVLFQVRRVHLLRLVRILQVTKREVGHLPNRGEVATVQ